MCVGKALAGQAGCGGIGPPRELMFEHDSHFNRRGHRRLAEVVVAPLEKGVAAALRRARLLEPSASGSVEAR